MSGDCGHGWGYHFLGASFPCFACMGYRTREEALEALVKKDAEVRDLKAKLRDRDARLRAVRKQNLYDAHGREMEDHEFAIHCATDLRNKNWRKARGEGR